MSHSNNRKSNRKLILRGSSIFQPLPKPRNCPALGIKLSYCICQHEISLVKDNILANKLAVYLVEWINDYIQSNNASDVCSKLSLKNNSIKLEEFEPRSHVDIYIVTFEVHPGGGQFSGHIALNFDKSQNSTIYKIISERLPRLNKYQGQSDCVKNDANITPYCYCKNLLTNTSKKLSKVNKPTK